MKLSSIVAIYFLFFCASAFVLLPFGVRTSEELGETVVPGQADSAPPSANAASGRTGAALFALYYANWTYGWVTPDDLDFYN